MESYESQAAPKYKVPGTVYGILGIGSRSAKRKDDMANCWIFQTRPSDYSLLGWFGDKMFERKNRMMTFEVRQHRKEIKYGDQVSTYMCESKSDEGKPGIYALARVASDIVEIKDPEELGGKYWRQPKPNEEPLNKDEPRVFLRIEKNYEKGPLWSTEELIQMGFRVGSVIGFQGTNHALEAAKCQKLLEALHRVTRNS